MRLTGGRTELDDFAACKITRKEDWVDLMRGRITLAAKRMTV